ncbi:MAG TPA: hypothetical protein VI456_09530 [Polyangia bacterium]
MVRLKVAEALQGKSLILVPGAAAGSPKLERRWVAFSTAGSNFEVGTMLLTLAIIVFAAWIIGLGLFQLAGTAIRLMIVLSVVVLILRMMWGRSARADLRPSPPSADLGRHQPVASGAAK